MPKLNKTNAKKAEEASSGFDPVPSRAYHVRLESVNPDGSGPKGPYWSWEFTILEDHEFEIEGKKGVQNALGRKLWNNTSLSDSAMFKMKETFDAFGVPTDTDTDEILGDCCKAIVGIRTIQEGARKGELANQIERLVPADADFEPPEQEPDPSPDDIFT
jgi:hypothetical protein